MRIPSREELTASIAVRAGVSPEQVRHVLVGHGVSLVPVPPAERSLEVQRLSFRGTRVNTRWDGPFEKSFAFGNGVTALITDENLRGKSTVLELITWALRGSPRGLRDDVKPWFDRITLEYSVNGNSMAVVLTKEESGFVGDILRAESAAVLRSVLEGETPVEAVHAIATGLSESEFAAQQDQLMLGLLSLEPITNFQRYAGSDDGRPQVNTWPAYFGGLYLPRAGSEILFGDTMFASLPARILQMFCNVPLMNDHIRLTTLTKQVKQDERHLSRRLAEDAEAREQERAALADQLKSVEAKLAALPSASARSHEVIAAELQDAERTLVSASAERRAAAQVFDEAKGARQAEQVRASNARETELAELLFQGLMPRHCPRCEQTIGLQRTQLELTEHHCAVCTRELPIKSDGDTSEEGEPEVGVDVLEALTQAEEAARQSAAEAAEDETRAGGRVDSLAAELSQASYSDEFANRMALQIEQARLGGRMESLPKSGIELEPSTSLAVLNAATEVLSDITATAAAELFADLNSEIVALGRKFGIDNLETVELDRRGGMKVTTAGVQSAFKSVTGGERLRLRVAVVVALLRVGHRSGVGSHPGLILLDSPGSDELTTDDEATLLSELDSLKEELPSLQVVIASAEPGAVLGHLPHDHVYSSLNGGPLW